jgi:hypothetical protein
MTAYNFITKTVYTGKNQVLTGKSKYNAFATFRQISNAGYKVNKGAKGKWIFCGFQPVDVLDSKGHIRTKTTPKGAIVFDIADTTAIKDKKLTATLR